MNNRIFVSLLLGALPLTMMAQDDDMYFVPSKKTHEHVAPHRDAPRSRPTYYSGSNRSVDEYNRRGFGSSYQVVSPDTTGNDIIQFSAERGVYPDSTMTEDFALTRQMARYDDYDVDLAYREGYRDGTTDSWHSPWFYSSYYPWYDSSYWYWNDPWYYRRYGWYYSWYDPWYYDWYRPYGYYSYYGPYYYGGGYWRGGGGRSSLYARNGNTGTINRSGRSHGYFTGGSRASSGTATRATQRATYNNNGNVYRSNSGNFSRSTSSSGNFSRSTTNSSSYNRSSSTSSSSSGSFSRSSGGGSFGGSSGGGGSRGGGSIGRAGRR